MANPITKEHATRIVKKLKAEVVSPRKGSAHDLALIYQDGRLVAQFGIRRGSQKGLPHNHIPSALHLSPHLCLLLAQCPYSREQWLQRMREMRLIG
jgi:hypothetical protein